MQVQTNYTEDLDEVVAVLCNLNFLATAYKQRFAYFSICKSSTNLQIFSYQQ